MIVLTVNGKSRELPASVTLLAFLETHGVDPRLIAVEYNGEIVRRGTYDTVSLQDGDRLEIVHMVGGGADRPADPQGSPGDPALMNGVSSEQAGRGSPVASEKHDAEPDGPD